MAAVALTAYQTFCSYAYIDKNSWLQVSIMVIIATLAIASAIYALSGILPTSNREKLRKVVRFEVVQGFLSILLIAGLLSFSLASCSIDQALVKGVYVPASGSNVAFTDPFQFANDYLGNAIFIQGTALVAHLRSIGFMDLIDGNSVSWIFHQINIRLGSGFTFGGAFGVEVSPSQEATYIYWDYASIPGFFSGFVVTAYGVLFLLYLMLPVIEEGGLLVLIPLAIIMRSLSFTGPRLREAANTVIAVSIAFYFVFPTTIAMDSSIMSWVYCTKGSVALANVPANPVSTTCNPFYVYLGPSPNADYQTLRNIEISDIFNGPPQVGSVGPFTSSLPSTFYGGLISSNAGFLKYFEDLVVNLINAPQEINNLIPPVAEYLFQGIILIALDMAITIGFAQGLAKGLGSLSNMMNIGPFW